MELWEQCKETGKRFTSFRGFLNHLRTLKMTSKEYYDKHYRKETEGKCKSCGKETSYKSFSYNRYCSDICYTTSDEHREIVSNRFINNPKALDSFRNKRKSKNIDLNIEKRNQTIKEKCSLLGISVEEFHRLAGLKGSLKISDEARRANTLRAMSTKEKTGNYGGRSGYKEYDLFGETVKLQGYEPIVLEYLKEILTKGELLASKSKIPTIPYYNKGKNRLYFPDFFIPKSNLLVEVKSIFTLEQHYDTVMKKCQASVDAGYNIVLLVLDKTEARNRRLDGSKKLLDWAISSQAPNPTWYGEGSTTILNGVGSSEPKSSPPILGDDIVWSV